MNKYLSMFRAGGKGKAFMRSADRVGKGISEALRGAEGGQPSMPQTPVLDIDDLVNGNPEEGKTAQGQYKSFSFNRLFGRKPTKNLKFRGKK